MTGKKKKKTIMESFKINELSGVDVPAQEGAQALLIKRNEKEENFLKGGNLRLTSDEKGHSHLLNTEEDGGTTTYNAEHAHPWIKNAEGLIALGAAESHSHSVLEKRFEPEEDGIDIEKRDFSPEDRRKFAEEGKALPDGSYPIVTKDDLRNAISAFGRAKNPALVSRHIKRRAKALGATEILPAEGDMALKSVKKEQTEMGDKEKKTVEMVEKSELQSVQKELEVAKALGALQDAEKAFYAGLTPDKRPSFLKLDADGRKAELEKASGDDPVVYKSERTGKEYRKSGNDEVLEAVKAADEACKIAKQAKDEQASVFYAKRAAEELNMLPGDLAVKKAILKAVDSIEEEKVRKSALALLKAGNDSMAQAFKKTGVGGEGPDSVKAEYEKISQAYAKTNNVTIEKARADVLFKTEEGKALAAKL